MQLPAEPLGRAVSRASTFRLPRWDDPAQQAADDQGLPPQSGPEGKGKIWTPCGYTDPVPGVDLPPPFPADSSRFPAEGVSADQPQAARAPADEAKKAQPKARHRRGRAKPSADVEQGAAGDDDVFGFDPGAVSDKRRSDSAAAVGRLLSRDGDALGDAVQRRRLGRSLYDAVQTHGHFGMVDSGETHGGVRRIIVHVPKRSRGYFLDIKPGEVIHANSGRGKPVGGRLDVQYVTRHQYFAPGRPVTSCVIGVPEEQWMRFVE